MTNHKSLAQLLTSHGTTTMSSYDTTPMSCLSTCPCHVSPRQVWCPSRPARIMCPRRPARIMCHPAGSRASLTLLDRVPVSSFTKCPRARVMCVTLFDPGSGEVMQAERTDSLEVMEKRCRLRGQARSIHNRMSCITLLDPNLCYFKLNHTVRLCWDHSHTALTLRLTHVGSLTYRSHSQAHIPLSWGDHSRTALTRRLTHISPHRLFRRHVA